MRLKNKLMAAGCIVAATAALVAGSACNEHELSPFSKSLSAGKLQNFSSGSARAVDILFVVDNSNSMSEEQRDLDKNFGKFLDRLIAANADFHLAVVTTEWLGTTNVAFETEMMKKGKVNEGEYTVSPRDVLKNAQGYDDAKIDEIAAKCAKYFGKERRFISSSDDDIAALEGDARKEYIQDLFRCEALVGAKTGGTAGIERGLATAVAALENTANDLPTAFKRKGSILTIVFVTDENDCSDVLAEEGVSKFADNATSEYLNMCETERNIEDSCTVTREDRVVNDNTSGSSLRLASGNVIEYNGKSLTTRQWCVQGDKEAREALTKAYDDCIQSHRSEASESMTDEDAYKTFASQCKQSTSIDCPDGRCRNKLNSRSFFFEKVLSLVIGTNEGYYRSTNKEKFDELKGKEDQKKRETELLRSFAKQDVIIANVINRDRGVRSDTGVTDKWCDSSGNPSYRYQWFAEMFENDPIYAPICCRREGFSVASTDKTSSDPTEVVCEASNPGGNSNFGPVLGLIGKRIGEAVNTLCTDTAPLTCEPKDCNVPTDDGIGYKNEPLDKPKAACPCLYGCNTSAKWAGTEREYFLCNEFRFNIGTIKEDAPIVSSEDASYTKYTEVTDYNIDYESSYCQTRTGSPIQINLQKAEAGRKLVIEYPKRVSAQ